MTPRPTSPVTVTNRRKAATILNKAVLERARGTDRNKIGCHLAKSWMTPCVCRDGAVCCDDDGLCVGCGHDPRALLRELRGDQG